MQALQYRKSVPRYLILKLAGGWGRRLVTTGLAPVSLRSVQEPRLPSPHWVRIAPSLAGVCGSDLATLGATNSPYLGALTSMPFVLGHEVVGRVTEIGTAVTHLRTGDRVVLHPALGCRAREIAPPCKVCAEGRDALCHNVTRGLIAPGIQTGYCRDTGGGFSSSLVAHESQAYAVPPSLDDRAAVLVEPFACALHAAYRVGVGDGQLVLVMGCGTIGLLLIAAFRAIGCRARVVAVGKYEHQRTRAAELGADEVTSTSGTVADRYARWASLVDAQVVPGELGKPAVIGGADAVFDCVASSESIDDGLRFTRAGGTFALVGMPGLPRGVDWTPMWYKELTVRAAYAYGPEHHPDGIRDTFHIAIQALTSGWSDRLRPLVGQPYRLEQYRAAFDEALNAGRRGTFKTVFEIP